VTGGLLHCARRELRTSLRDYAAMMIYLLMPLAVGGMIIGVSGGGAPQPTATLLVVDEDDSFLSRGLLAAMDRAGDGELIQTRVMERAEGEAAIASGEASALLVIPDGFGAAVVDERPTTLALTTNPAQQILPAIVEEFLRVAADGVFYLHRVFGDEIRQIRGRIDAMEADANGPFDDAGIAAVSIAINERIETAVPYLDPLALQLAGPEPEAGDDGTSVSFGMVFFPGIVFMGMLLAAQSLSDGYWKERDQGTLRRVIVSPLTPIDLLGGKMLAAAAIMALLSGLITALGFLYLDLSFAMWLPALLWLTLSGLVMAGLMALLQLLAPTQRSGSLLTSLLLFPLLMIGGAFFPFETLPDWLAAIGRWVPNGYLLERLKSYLVYDGGLQALLGGLPVALIMLGVLWGLCAWRIGRFAGRA
jgi:ABC-type Na+ efflux pump permease subunit